MVIFVTTFITFYYACIVNIINFPRENIALTTGLDRPVVQVKELVTYIGYQRKQHQYNDYTGVAIAAEYVNLLQNMIGV